MVRLVQTAQVLSDKYSDKCGGGRGLAATHPVTILDIRRRTN